MNKTLALLSATLALAALPAFAQEGTQDFDTSRLSSRTRAEVRAEFEAARLAGTLDTHQSGPAYGSFRAGELASSASRAQVRAELAHALDAGQHLSRGERAGG